MAKINLSDQLHSRLEALIADAEPGQRLPSEPKLAKEFGVSRATLREAMRTFETQGLLRRRQGVGTFVTRPSHIIESGLEVLESIERQAERIGLPVSMGAMDVSVIIVDENIASNLELSPGSEAIHVSRVILAEDRPVAYLVDILPKKIFNPEEFNNRFTGSVLDLLLRRGEPSLGSSRCEIAAVAAPPEIARSLDIQRGDSILVFEAMLFTSMGEPVDYSFSYFLPGYFRFHVVRRVG
jgi:GntR family transcriptional regulator